MKLIVQPDDGATPIVSAIRKAKESIEAVVFRLDQRAIEAELQAAAARGVKVTVLIASVNRGGAESLRKLELRCLAAGLTVGRTNDDLVRYHDKFFIIDRRTLYVLSWWTGAISYYQENPLMNPQGLRSCPDTKNGQIRRQPARVSITACRPRRLS